MKKPFLSLLVALMATVVAQAQLIAVVSGSSTNTYKTLEAAIEASSEGSVIYLPGGGFPISDEVKISKKITIIGIGYNSEADNAGGRTQISGNLYFDAGSDDSAVMGCYVDGDIFIGDGNKQVDNILIKYCNLKSVQVQNSSCRGTEVNQNLIRDYSHFHNANALIENNVLHSLAGVNGGYILNNVITSFNNVDGSYPLNVCKDCVISGNVFTGPQTIGKILNGKDCQATGNMMKSKWGDDCISISGEWSDVFENCAGVNPVSNYHFKEAYQQYEGVCGIYSGEGFSDGQLPPVPYISFKSVPRETDASGNLHINITVNAK